MFFLLILTDFISKIGAMYDLPFRYSSIGIKILFQIMILFYVFKIKALESINVIKYVVIIGLIFLLGQLFITSEESFLNRVFENSKVFNWYLFIFVIAAGYFSFEKESKILNLQKEKLFQTFELIFILNSFCILIGLLFDLNLFSSYSYGRFGYNGFLRNPTHASYIYIIYIIYFYYKHAIAPLPKNKYLLITACIIPFLLGTKAVLLFLTLFLIYYTLKHRFYSILIAFFIVFSAGIVKFDFLMNTFVKKHFLVLYNAYHENGMVSMLFSLRNESIDKIFIPYITKHWTSLNYFLGGAEFNLFRTEFEFIDLFWFFGIVGTLLYLFIFDKYVLNRRILFTFKLLLMLFVVVFLAGSFLSSAPVMLFFYVLCVFLKDIYSKEKIKNL